jgi:dihydrolipoamide dehydrogenase
MLANKDAAVNGLTGGVEKYLFTKYPVAYKKGFASFNSASEIAIKLNDGGEETVKAKNVIIATGSEVTPFPGMEIDEKVIVSSTGALDLQEVPKKVRLCSQSSSGRALLLPRPFPDAATPSTFSRARR